MSVRVKIFFAAIVSVAILTAASIGMDFILMRMRIPQVLPSHMNATAFFLSLGAMIIIAASVELVKQFKMAEERIANLSESTKTAASMSESRNRLIADMRHEMRKPLNSVVRLSRYMLDKEEMPEETRESVEKIHNAGMTLLGVINDIIDVSKLESRQFEITPIEYDVPSLINDIVTLNAAYIGDKQIRFDLHIGKTMPSKLFGDELRVELVCNNLLGNAFKYTREGKIDLSFDCERRGDDEWLTIRVSDTGVGIPPENIEGLFSGYNRVYTKLGGKIEGTCLPVTKAIVTMMGGAITAESEYGKGSVFIVRIPQGFVTDAPIGDEVAKNLQRFNYRGRKLSDETRLVHVQLPHARVLVVDDIQANLDIIKELLELYGMKVDCLTSGLQAVQRIYEETFFYDAIFMDHMMPGMDGVETLRVIREDIGSAYAKNIPIIALTANVTSENGEEYIGKGFQAFLSKPIDVFQLDDVVIRWLKDRETAKEYFENSVNGGAGDDILSLIGYPVGWVSANLY
ncbi:MAG: response regulator [Synergistaceae bacterium]|jgi:signal transduction histidine kinase/ActR/RegA family two-component response regulator|nr:response regulator [Synergistaceae bacterium]